MGNKIVHREQAYPNGNHYIGDFKGARRHGQGTYTWGDDGTSYTGSWVNNEQSGYGVTTFKNGNKYSGNFRRNNMHGQGKLETQTGETIEGYWDFKGRANHVPNSYTSPVATYVLNVEVRNASGIAVSYQGPATFHLKSGMVVLPNMSAPGESVYSAVVVSDPSGKQNFAVSDSKAVEAVPVNQGITPGSVPVAYGAQDQALGPRPEPKTVPINPLDPRNYF